MISLHRCTRARRISFRSHRAGERPPPPPLCRHRAVPVMAVMLTGESGWVGIDRTITQTLLDRGIPVVGFDMPAYLKNKRTPDQMGADLARVVRFYLDSWGADSVLLIGDARGASALTFMAARLPADLRSRVKLVGLLEPGLQLESMPTLPEAAHLTGLAVVCVYGRKESNMLCPEMPPAVGQRDRDRWQPSPRQGLRDADRPAPRARCALKGHVGFAAAALSEFRLRRRGGVVGFLLFLRCDVGQEVHGGLVLARLQGTVGDRDAQDRWRASDRMRDEGRRARSPARGTSRGSYLTAAAVE